VTIAVDGFL